MNRTVLCTVEYFTEIDSIGTNVQGTLASVGYNQNFYLYWTPLDGTSTQNITAVFDYEKIKEGDNWTLFEPFCFDCSKLGRFEFSENPYSIKININNNKLFRTFQITETELIPLTILIEQLLLNGIAVPSVSSRYSLEFYKGAHYGTYAFIPAHIQLNDRLFKNLEELWNNVLKFFEKLMIHLDASHAIPSDPAFPINTAARAVHLRVIEKINDYINNIPVYADITKESYAEAFDSAGKLKNPSEFKLRLFHSNKDQDLLPELIPFAMNVYPLDSTKQEREEIYKKLTKEFYSLQEQVKLIQQPQIDGNSKLFSTFRVIDHDVARTDRLNPAFKNDNSPGLLILSDFLKMYAIYNPPISYLQGMNDLFVPFITTFIPKWGDDGTPLDKDGNTLDYEPIKPMIFWCYESMLINTQQIKLLENVTGHCGHIAEQVEEILNKVSPLCSIWLRRHNLQGLLWCFSDFVLLFKRSFDDIWTTWMQFNACEEPDRFLLYFITAVLIASFDSYLLMTDITMTSMMEAFPRVLATLVPVNIGKIALWIQEYYAVTNKEVKKQNLELPNFEFFKPDWN